MKPSAPPPPKDEARPSHRLGDIPSEMLPGVLQLKDGRRLRAERREGDTWYVRDEERAMALRTLAIEPLVDAFEPFSARAYDGRDPKKGDPADVDPAADPQEDGRTARPSRPSPDPAPGVDPRAEPKTDHREGRRQSPGRPDEEGEAAPQEDAIELIQPITSLVAWRLFRRERLGLFGQLCAAAFVSNLLGFALPLFTMAVYDRVVPHNAIETLWAFTIGLGLVFVVDLILRFTRARLQEAMGLGANLEVQGALYGRLTRAELAATPRSPGPMTAAFQSVEAICLSMPQLAVGLFVDLPFVIVTLIYIGIIGGPIVLAPIVAILLIVGVGVAAHIAARRPTVAAAALSSQRLGMIDETASALEQVKSLGAARVFDRIWRRLVDGAGYQGHLSRMSSAYATQATVILGQVTTVACLVIGVGLITAGEITIGALVATTILVGRTIQPVTTLVSTGLRVAAVTESASAAEVLSAAPEETAGDGTAAGARLSGRIDLLDLSFAYPNAAEPTLRDLTLSITPGERLAVIGKIGCGKSTIAKLLPRLYTAEGGALLLDGRDIRQYAPDDLRENVAYMSQDVDLFDDTIFENVCIGIEDVCPHRLSQAVRASGVEEIVARRPEGMSFRVGPRGRRLSGGERQAVALARALVRDAQILVLDEPTAAMDSQLERALIDRMKPLLAGKTVILCTHRAPTLALVDRVVWLESGRILTEGPPSEIVQRVSAMAKSQSGGAAAPGAPRAGDDRGVSGHGA